MKKCLYCDTKEGQIKDHEGEMICYECRVGLLEQEFKGIPYQVKPTESDFEDYFQDFEPVYEQPGMRFE